MSEALSAYEQLRAANIAENKKELVALGLETDVSEMRAAAKPKAVKRPREQAPPQKPARGSRRLAGEAADAAQPESGPESPLDAADPGERKKINPSNKRRLTSEQQQLLDSLEEVASAAPLDAEEIQAVQQLREYLVADEGIYLSTTNGTGKMRQTLREAIDLFDKLRWPAWLEKLEQAMPRIHRHMGLNPMSEANLHKVMWALEKAACGLGLEYDAWPEGVGVFLGSDEAEAASKPPPRILTLGADTEAFRREGQRLEMSHGKDRSNGWLYNHPLGKLRGYQEILLQAPPWNQSPSAASIAELEEAADEAAE